MLGSGPEENHRGLANQIPILVDAEVEPIAFEIEGRQHIAVAAGKAILVFGL
jgi:hypothetical protein